MAETGRPLKRLREETTCDICSNFFTDPVLLGCGYSFCRACAETLSPPDCPHCGAAFDQSRLRTNRSLVSIVEVAKKLTERESAEGAGEEGGREERQRGAVLGEAEKALLSGAGGASEEQQHPRVDCMKAAAREVKMYLRKFLDNLKEEKVNILLTKTGSEVDSLRASRQTKVAWEETKIEFKRMHAFLDNQKERLLTQVTEVQNAVKIKQKELIFALSRRQSFLESHIQEIEEKIQQPLNEFLQDIGGFLKRYEEREKFHDLVFLSPELRCKVWNLMEQNRFLLRSMKRFKGSLESGLRQLEENTNGGHPSSTTPEESEQPGTSTSE